MKGIGLLGLLALALLGKKNGETTPPSYDWEHLFPSPLLTVPINEHVELGAQPLVAAAPSMEVPSIGSTGSHTLGTIAPPVYESRTVQEIVPVSSWSWQTPSGLVYSRPPTPEEEASLECPEVPGIWEYPIQSAADIRYCTNPQCPSNLPIDPRDISWTENPDIKPTPATLFDQGADSPPGKRWYCAVCNTYQG